MICKYCQTAADMQSRVNDIEDDKHVPFGMKTALSDFRKMGVTMHQYCKGCDCQHLPMERGKHVQEQLASDSGAVV